MLSTEEEAGLIVTLQDVYQGKRNELDSLLLHLDESRDSLISDLITIHRDSVSKTLRTPRFFDVIQTTELFLRQYAQRYAECVILFSEANTPHCSGTEGDVYFHQNTRKPVAIKHYTKNPTSNFLSQSSVLLRTQDITGTSTIQAMSLRNHVIVTDIVDGTPLSHFPHHTTPFHDGHIRDYLDRILQMIERDVYLDNNPSNYLLSKKRIGIIDFDDWNFNVRQRSNSLAARIDHGISPLYQINRHVINPEDIVFSIHRAICLIGRIIDIVCHCFPQYMEVFQRAYSGCERHSLFHLMKYRKMVEGLSFPAQQSSLVEEIYERIQNIESTLLS